MHSPFAPRSIAAACIAILLWNMGPAQAAERKLADLQPFSASVPAGFTCRPEVTVTVRAPEDSAFTSNRVELQKLVGGLRAILGFECPNTPITNLLVAGEAGGKEVYRGAASESGNWLLADLQAATTSTPAEQAAVPVEQGSVPKEVTAPEQLPRETAKAGSVPTPKPQQGQQPSGSSALVPAEQATIPVGGGSASKEAATTSNASCGVLEPPPVGFYDENRRQYGNITGTWSGSCVNGLAQGRGTLTWYNEGRSFFTEEFIDTNGLVMNAGRAAASDAVNERAVVWKLDRCESLARVNYRSADGQVSTDLNLGYRVVSDKLLGLGVQFVSKHCPSTDRDNITISLHQGVFGNIFIRGTTVKDGSFVDFPPPNSCGDSNRKYTNVFCSRRLDSGHAAWVAAAKQRADDVARARQEAERQQQAQAAERARQQKAELRSQMKARLDNFLQQNGASSLVPLKDLKDNPFRYEGSVIAVQAFYVEMLSRDLSHFQSRGGFLVVSGLDPKHSMKQGADVLLAGTVAGSHPLRHDLLVPLLALKSMHVCQMRNCEDIIPPSVTGQVCSGGIYEQSDGRSGKFDVTAGEIKGRRIIRIDLSGTDGKNTPLLIDLTNYSATTITAGQPRPVKFRGDSQAGRAAMMEDALGTSGLRVTNNNVRCSESKVIIDVFELGDAPASRQ